MARKITGSRAVLGKFISSPWRNLFFLHTICPCTFHAVLTPQPGQEFHHTKSGVMSPALEELVGGPCRISHWRLNGKTESLEPLSCCSLPGKPLPGFALSGCPFQGCQCRCITLESCSTANHQSVQTAKTSVTFKQNGSKHFLCNNLENRGWGFLHPMAGGGTR